MNIARGAQRFKDLGKSLFYTAGVVLAFAVAAIVIALLFPKLGIPGSVASFIFLPMLIAIPGAGLWVTGWIVEGFADDKR